jgi:hypothetical protein
LKDLSLDGRMILKCTLNRVWTRSWHSSVSIVSDCRLDDRGSIPSRGKGFFPLASVSRPALRPTQPPIQWVPVVLSQG